MSNLNHKEIVAMQKASLSEGYSLGVFTDTPAITVASAVALSEEMKNQGMQTVEVSYIEGDMILRTPLPVRDLGEFSSLVDHTKKQVELIKNPNTDQILSCARQTLCNIDQIRTRRANEYELSIQESIHMSYHF